MTRHRFLLDQMLDEGVAIALRDFGHDVVRVDTIGLATVGDDEILAQAVSDNRILITLDEHFGDWAVLPLDHHPGVVRVKATPTTTSAILDLLLPFFNAHLNAFFDDTLVIIRKSGVRWIHTSK